MADGKTQSEKVEGVARDLQRDEADARWQGLCARWVRNLRRRSRMRGKPQRAITVTLFLLIAACGDEDQIDGYASLERHVANSRVGADVDHWIEMKIWPGSGSAPA